MKECSTCRLVKPEDQFYKRSNKCKFCRNEYLRAYREANREQILEKRRQDYKDNLEREHARQREYRQSHSESRKAYWDKWYEENREARLEYHKIYRQENQEAFRERERNRYSRDPHVSARRLVQGMVADGRLPCACDLHCVDCGGNAEDYDHYLGYEGINRRMVQPVCRPCHLKREAKRKEVTNV